MPLRRLGRQRARRIALLLLGAALAASGCGPEGEWPRPKVERTVGTLKHSNSKAGSAILRVDNMKPGDVDTGEVTIANTGTLAGVFFLSASSVDEVPGPGGGKLSDRLTLDVQEVSRAGRPGLVYSGPLLALGKTAVGTLTPRSVRTYRFTVRLGSLSPSATPADENSYQNSSLRVNYYWTATAAAPPRLNSSAPGKQRVARKRPITLKARCDRACTVTAAATLKVRGRRRPMQLGATRRSLRARQSKKLTIRLSRSALATIDRAGSRRRPAKVTVTVAVRDSAGLTATTKHVVKVYGSRR